MTTKPLYRQIFEEIRDSIQSGKFKPGDKIPTESEWAKKYKVSRLTSQKAMNLAVENYLITKYPGKGSFVNSGTKKVLRQSGRLGKKVIGIIEQSCSDSYGLEILVTIEKLAHEADVITVFGISDDDIEVEKGLIKQFAEFGVDGLVILLAHNEKFNYAILQLILDGFPVVLIDRFLKEISCPNVISKNFEAANRGMEYLYSLGHRKIGIASRPIGLTSTLQERVNGIMNAATASGYKINREWWLTNMANLDKKKDFNLLQDLKELVKEYLLQNKELTAIFCLEYFVLQIVEAAAYDLGIRIPEDLSLLCFDSPERIINTSRSVTHMRQNEKAIANTSFSLIMKMIQGEPIEYRHEIDIDLVVGNTTMAIIDD